MIRKIQGDQLVYFLLVQEDLIGAGGLQRPEAGMLVTGIGMQVADQWSGPLLIGLNYKRLIKHGTYAVNLP